MKFVVKITIEVDMTTIYKYDRLDLGHSSEANR